MLHMASTEPRGRGPLKLATVLLTAGLLLILLGSLVQREWPTGMTLASLVLALAAASLLCYSQLGRGAQGSDR